MKRSMSGEAAAAAEELRRTGHTPAQPDQQCQRSPYEVLGVPPGADLLEIRRAFLRAVRVYQPGSHPAEFLCVTEAYEMLKDPVRRAAFDQELEDDRGSIFGKRRRTSGGPCLTPGTAAAFLSAQNSRQPVFALDPGGLCHPVLLNCSASSSSRSDSGGPTTSAQPAGPPANQPSLGLSPFANGGDVAGGIGCLRSRGAPGSLGARGFGTAFGSNADNGRKLLPAEATSSHPFSQHFRESRRGSDDISWEDSDVGSLARNRADSDASMGGLERTDSVSFGEMMGIG